MGRLAGGVAVIGTAHDGTCYGMTVNSFVSVSLDPLLVLFCCERDASLHGPVLASGVWGVSILSAEQQDLARWFATRGIPGEDQFRGRPHRCGQLTGVPLLEGSLAWFECRTWATYDGGDHTIVVGEVLDLALGNDGAALLYHRSAYAAAPPPVVATRADDQGQ
jgi:flavin reductase (DIM6/NTAB) family NADH-FMN oxidoreductase RutF